MRVATISTTVSAPTPSGTRVGRSSVDDGHECFVRVSVEANVSKRRLTRLVDEAARDTANFLGLRLRRPVKKKAVRA